MTTEPEERVGPWWKEGGHFLLILLYWLFLLGLFGETTMPKQRGPMLDVLILLVIAFGIWRVVRKRRRARRDA